MNVIEERLEAAVDGYVERVKFIEAHKRELAAYTKTCKTGGFSKELLEYVAQDKGFLDKAKGAAMVKQKKAWDEFVKSQSISPPLELKMNPAA